MAAEISFKNIKRHDVQKIGMAYINHLVEKGDYDSAARWVTCSSDVQLIHSFDNIAETVCFKGAVWRI